MIIPNVGRVLVKVIKREDAITKNGIIIPGTETVAESLLFGEVVSEGHKQFKKGTQVFYSRYSALGVMDKDGNSFFIVSDLDILAVEE